MEDVSRFLVAPTSIGLSEARGSVQPRLKKLLLLRPLVATGERGLAALVLECAYDMRNCYPRRCRTSFFSRPGGAEVPRKDARECSGNVAESGLAPSIGSTRGMQQHGVPTERFKHNEVLQSAERR